MTFYKNDGCTGMISVKFLTITNFKTCKFASIVKFSSQEKLFK